MPVEEIHKAAPTGLSLAEDLRGNLVYVRVGLAPADPVPLVRADALWLQYYMPQSSTLVCSIGLCGKTPAHDGVFPIVT